LDSRRQGRREGNSNHQEVKIMKVKKSLFVLSGMLALAAGLQASAVLAHNCGFALPVPSPSSNGECLSSNAHAFVRASVATGTGNDTWTYRLNWVSGPTDPVATASLVNADGATRTKDVISGVACKQAKDPTIDGNFGPAQVCVTPKQSDRLSPRGMLVFLSGA
jgi:hypothetical protein